MQCSLHSRPVHQFCPQSKKRLRLAPGAVPSHPPLQPLSHRPFTPGHEPGASGNRGSCIVHSAKGAGPRASRHAPVLSVTLTILLRSNMDIKAFHSSPFCYRPDKFSEELASVSWSESESDGSNK